MPPPPLAGAVAASPDRSVFVGRATETATLAGLLTDDGDAHAPCAIVAGAPGIGKTALLDEMAARAAVDGAHVVLRAVADPAETDLDFGVIDQLLRAGRRHLGMPGGTPRGSGALEVGALLVQATDAFDGRLLVVIDDAHAADDPSLHALSFAARRLAADRIAVLIGTRPEGLPRIPHGLRTLAEAPGRVLTLDGFALDEVQQLAASTRGARLHPTAAERLHRHTGGHPLHTRILLEQAEGDDIDMPVAPSLTRLLADRLVGCSPRARLLLEALAVIDAPTTIADAARLAGLAAPLDAVDELAVSGLIDISDGRFDGEPVRSAAASVMSLRHRLIQEAVYDGLADDRRAAMHADAARLTTGAAALRHRVAAASGPDPDLADALAAQAAA
ncbi:MAG: AAA family ATPase, partial [Microbacterium sp.]